MPVTFLKPLFSSENISSEGFRIGLLIPMPFGARRHHCHLCRLYGYPVEVGDNERPKADPADSISQDQL